ncbi:MAG TPA: hypothetical protein VNJ01_11005 [Bacteriovoracaceae bacterium]|nr:hypothetical protein [Bacteriovoracaceae bacterium]
MKIIILLLSLVSITAFADLVNGDKPKMLYTPVAVESLMSARVKSRLTNGYHKGSLKLKLQVNGNLCGDPARYFGKMYDWKDEGREIKLISGTKLPGPDHCTAEYKETEIVVVEKLLMERGGKHIFFLRVGETLKTITVTEDGVRLRVTVTD